MDDAILLQIEDLIAQGKFQASMEVFLEATRVISPGIAPEAFRDARVIRTQAALISGEFGELEKRKVRRQITEADYTVARTSLLTRMLRLAAQTEALLDRPEVVPPAQEPSTDVTVIKEAVPQRINGRSTLQSIAWLEEGIRAARSVVRVIPPRATDASTGIGTGFLLPGGWVMTNNHVVSDPAVIAKTKIETNFERDVDDELKPTSYYGATTEGMITIGRDDAGAFWDVTFFRVTERPGGVPLSHWGTLDLEPNRMPARGEYLSIVQHPGGAEKKIAVTANQCYRVAGQRIEYMTDTLKGSSGSPVFDTNWKVVGIHRAGGKEEIIGNRRIFPNEGVAMARILELPDVQLIRDEILKT